MAGNIGTTPLGDVSPRSKFYHRRGMKEQASITRRCMCLFAVEGVKMYKPPQRVYALGPHTLNTPAEEILFVSSNSWDAAGAKAFGYRMGWCNRSGAEIKHLRFAPDIVVSGLHDLVNVMAVAF